VLLPACDSDQARAFAERVQLELKLPFDLDGRTWFISASIGIGIGMPGTAESLNLVREAGIALVSAKANPTSRIELFDPIRSRFAIERVKLETELRAALEHDELMAYYQPIIDLATEGIVGFEALARWQHPERGLVLPVDFIGLAEESDLIVPLGNSMLEKACTQAQAWRERWPDQDLVMSVNLSPRQFADPGLAPAIESVLRRTGLDPHALELEITEGSVMDRSAAGLGVLEDLRALGVRIVLDDFGMGYSSLAYLRQLPLDIIKIDQSFVTELDSRDPNVGIVRAVVSLARGLGVKVVAEGIETPEQARRLRVLGCDMGQGYRWARPTDADGVEALVEDRLERVRPSRSSVRRSRAAARLVSAV
jgi:EAL domain-containing protein (putative c-di-GMP-specific phosphodiesterase class I)